jgi:hypothetical protein
MRNIICTLFFLALAFCFNPASAQPGQGKISGVVRSQADKPVEAATVSLLRAKDSVLVKTSLTDTEGRFEFENLSDDTCIITITSVGFAGYRSEPFTISSSIPVELPMVRLQDPGAALQGVTVTATKSFIERRLDKTIVNPDALIANAGANTLEVLEKSPGVQVDVNGTISLKGKAGVLILIDDRPTHLSGAALASYLRSLPAGTLNNIEIMTNPPARYDAAGNAGVINIRLKKNIVKGFSGNFSTSYAQGFYPRTSNSFNFNYRINKVNFFSNLSYNINNDYQDLDIERNYLKNDGSLHSIFRQGSFIKNERRGANGRIGMDYYISKKATMGIVLSGFSNPAKITTTSNADFLNSNKVIDSLITARNDQEEKLRNGSINVNYNYKFDGQGRELTLNADHIKYKFNSDQALVTSTYLTDGTLRSSSNLIGNLPTRIGITSAKLDYVNPLKGGGNLEAGLKKSYINTENVANFFDRKNNVTTINYDLSNDFRYEEDINAAYLNFNRDFQRLSLQMGLRVENTVIKGNQLGNAQKPDSSFRRNYTSLFPTFYVSYKLDTNNLHQINFSYGRRIQRPNYQDLNPFIYPLDRFTYFAGNPYLQPTFSHNLELAHTYKNILTTTLQYNYTKDIIQETIEQNGNLFISRPGNIGEQIDIGVSINASIQPKKIRWWSMQLYSEVMNNHFRGVLYGEELDTRGTYWLLSGSSQFKINKLWSAELGGFYKSSAVTGQFLGDPIWIMRVGASKKITKEKGTVRFVLNDIFYSFQPRGRITGISNATATYHNYLDSRVATLSFSYRFSRGSSLKARQSGAADTEKSRVKTGN